MHIIVAHVSHRTWFVYPVTVLGQGLHSAAEQFFADARGRRAGLAADPATIAGILDDGAARAREQAQQVLDRARAACGLSRRAGARS